MMPRLYAHIGTMFCVILLISVVDAPVIAQPHTLDRNQQTGCPVLPLEPSAADGGELSDIEKTVAFADVFANGSSYQDYSFALDTSVTPPGTIPPVIVKSMAGIESDWFQPMDQLLMPQHR